MPSSNTYTETVTNRLTPVTLPPTSECTEATMTDWELELLDPDYVSARESAGKAGE